MLLAVYSVAMIYEKKVSLRVYYIYSATTEPSLVTD